MRYDDEDEEGWTGPALVIGAGGAIVMTVLGIVLTFKEVREFAAVQGQGAAAQWETLVSVIPAILIWLLAAAAFAALAGWAFESRRSAPAERKLRRERDHLLRDLVGMAMGDAGESDEAERIRGEEALRGQLGVRDARIAELEQALERARDAADEAAAEIAELQRRNERAEEDARELERLRALDTAREQQRLIDVRAEAHEPGPDDAALQAWRLRYFEQRVRYLENLARPEPPASVPAPAPAREAVTEQPSAEMQAALWRAREAQARAAFLENELRGASAASASEPPSAEPETPFAANADVDMLLRWRLLYLERRVAHLQAQAAAGPSAVSEAPAEPAPLVADAAPDPDRWKWRARYLEARVRHLEQRLAERSAPSEPPPAQRAVELTAAEDEAPEPPPPPPADQPRRKPVVLGAPRNGAPDDLTMIDGVSSMQQSTLYSIGIYHFDQIAEWSAENVAWVDNYLRLRGRIDEEEWVEQAAALARELAGA